jgi:hypothetical protein
VTAPAAQAAVDACRLVAAGAPLVPVPTLEGDLMCGYGYFARLPIGSTFRSGGALYRITRRVFLRTAGGTEPADIWGGVLDLHTCLSTGGSVLVWAVRE